jgi:hypothetical protein
VRSLRFWPILSILLSREAAAISPLASRGYAVLPEPRRVELGASDFRFGPAWLVEKKGVAANDFAAASLAEGLKSRFHLPGPGGGAGAIQITLAIAPGSVSIGEALDSDKAAIAAQAYRLELSSRGIAVSANRTPGLFYGVQTLLQLITQRDDGSLRLPEGRIVDWPDLRLRYIYWDDAHHLDRPETLRNAALGIDADDRAQHMSRAGVVRITLLLPCNLNSTTAPRGGM